MELHRSIHGKIIAGVCSGIAECLRVDPLFIRLAFLLFIFPTGAIIYIALALILPEIDNYDSSRRLIIRPREGRIIGGVCKGIADAFMFDVSIIRIALILTSLFFGSGIFIYLIVWIIVPSEK
ncbi:MAG TPA: PspC domain-containing protein [Candidatus Cloacimonadota bacterium]|jgi:phage shock protein PspC (stress-responsive transcriptional regulator)|nr:PspC domain-containing protein [Candidatus Cloacimonadales bacterium]HPY96396.1 PspC domain-containing protein [Candidatus Cloacimonadota bacterium]HQB40689.1 PspC domain-containing protein [Candidatus Cloacimonadota bacterium]